ncbi:MAG TPA: DUF3379 family protein [Rhodanobacteraceae bacterium]
MDCLEFRRRLAAEPRVRDPDFVAHRDSCHAGCTEAWWRAQKLERRIENALAVDAPGQLAERVLLAQATQARARTRLWRSGLALAASLVLAASIGIFGWNRTAGADPLPAISVAHLHAESFALASTQPIAEKLVREEFAARGLALHAMPADAVFVRDCDLGSYRTVHMVFRVDGEPVTAMYFIGHEIASAREFDRGGWRGREVPMGKGTLLLLGADARGFAAVERSMGDALQGPARQAVGQL